MAIKVMDEREILRPEFASKSRPAGTPRSTRRVHSVPLGDRLTSELRVADNNQNESTEVNAIAQLAVICSSRDSQRLKKRNPADSGTGSGAKLVLGVVAFAAVAIFVGAPFLHSSFRFDRSPHPSSVLHHTVFAMKTLLAQPVARAYPGAASPDLKYPETTSRPLQTPMSTMGGAHAYAVKSATVMIGNHTTENIHGSQPANVGKAVGQTLGETATAKSKPSGFDVNHPPGALFSRVSGR